MALETLNQTDQADSSETSKTGLPKSETSSINSEFPEAAEYRAALKKSVDALENRNSNTNWFALAGAFAKPTRTGGFGESLGNAATELGNQQAKREEQELPIAQMRAQLAGSNYQLARQQQGAKMLGQILGTSPANAKSTLSSGNTPGLGRTASGAQLASLMMYDKDAGNALKAGIEADQKTAENAIKLLDSGVEISKATAGMSAEQRKDFLSNIDTYRAITGIPGPQLSRAQSMFADPATAARDAGIPVLSGLRSNNALYANSVQNGTPGMQPNGVPVAKPGSSMHETGNAIDVDMKKLTTEGRQWLDDNKYIQPKWATDPKHPQYDPNHWEKAGSSIPSQSAQRPYENQEQYAARMAKLEEPQIKDASEITSGLSKTDVDSLMTSNADLNALKAIAAKPNANKIFAPLQLQGGETYAQAATKVAIQQMKEGAQVTAGSIHAGIGVNFEPVYQNLKLSPDEKVEAARAQQIIAQQVINNIIANKTKAFGGSRVTNYQDQQLSALNANMAQLPKFIESWATRRQVDNAALMDAHREWTSFQQKALQSNRPVDPREFVLSDEYLKQIPARHKAKIDEVNNYYK
jgi:LAS superfamily LD-carboxypeptidase LdcB